MLELSQSVVAGRRVRNVRDTSDGVSVMQSPQQAVEGLQLVRN